MPMTRGRGRVALTSDHDSCDDGARDVVKEVESNPYLYSVKQLERGPYTDAAAVKG